jgi:molybdopterin-guanine dinucleotide biosynthesis protein A
MTTGAMTDRITGAVTGAILAGGLSRRMGFNKAHIKLGGQTVLERNIKIFAGIFAETMVVTSLDTPYTGLPARVVTDIHPGAGSLGGIYTALFHSDGPVFVAACDMPGLDPEAIRAVIKASEIDMEFDVCIPFIEGREHPMHALYRPSCLKPILTMIEAGRLRVSGLLKELRVLRLTDENFKEIAIAASVANINTPEELKGIKGAQRPDGE